VRAMACAARVPVRSCATARPGLTICLVMRSTLGGSLWRLREGQRCRNQEERKPAVERLNIIKLSVTDRREPNRSRPPAINRFVGA